MTRKMLAKCPDCGWSDTNPNNSEDKNAIAKAISELQKKHNRGHNCHQIIPWTWQATKS